MTMQQDVLSVVVNYVTDQQLGQPAESNVSMQFAAADVKRFITPLTMLLKHLVLTYVYKHICLTILHFVRLMSHFIAYVHTYIPSSSLLRDGESMKNAINSHLTASFVTSVYGKKYPVE
uniref:Uncharacterized protein n=1 Tax=Glossina pallidipes TaxID=7398 RepID=A0A1B0AG52_GLOPL